MRKIFDFSFLILFAVILQEMVAVFDGNTELSSVPHIRQKRMNRQPGSSSSSSNARPPWFENLKHVNMESPTFVEITTFDNSTEPGYAIHPYFVLTRREYTLQGFSIFYDSGRLRRQPIEKCLQGASGELVLIQLVNPIMMNNPVHHHFFAEDRLFRATEWAKIQVQLWIFHNQPHFHPRPQQILTEVRLSDPTKVVMTQNGERIGHGYAINPFIVVARRDFVRETVGVLSYTESRGELKSHRIKNVLIDAEYGLVRLGNPVLLAVPVPNAFINENFDIARLSWAENMAHVWIRDILNG